MTVGGYEEVWMVMMKRDHEDDYGKGDDESALAAAVTHGEGWKSFCRMVMGCSLHC